MNQIELEFLNIKDRNFGNAFQVDDNNARVNFSRYVFPDDLPPIETVKIEAICAEPLRQRYGSRLLKKICDAADSCNITLIAFVSPSGCVEQDRVWLHNWYQTFNFILHQKKGENWIIRLPLRLLNAPP